VCVCVYIYICVTHTGMSAQCWCYDCAGRVVDRKTFIRHGRKSVPDPPISENKVEIVSMEEVEEPDDFSGTDVDEDSKDDEDEGAWTSELWDKLLRNDSGNRFGRGQLTHAHVSCARARCAHTHVLSLHCATICT